MQQTFIVIDSHGFVNALIEASHHYVTDPPLVTKLVRTQVGVRETPSHGLVPVYSEHEEEIQADPIQPLDRLRAIGILQALTDEVLSQQLYYRTHRNPIAQVARYLRNTAVATPQDHELAEHFLCLPEVDTVVIELNRQVCGYLGEDLWRLWEVAQVPTLVGLIGGQDFRIAEWERTRLIRVPAETQKYSVSIGSIANCILHQLQARVGMVAHQIPMRAVIAEGLMYHYPKFRFKTTEELPLDLLASWGYPTFQVFYNEFARSVVDAFKVTFLACRIDEDEFYDAYIGPNFVLELTKAEPGKSDEERRYHELKFSLSNGDWIPERDRRWLEEYERTR